MNDTTPTTNITTKPPVLGGAVREAGRILLAGTLLSLLYTGIMKKGLFEREKPETSTSQTEADLSPVYADYADARRFFESGDALFVDTRHEFDYLLGHISGAINLPLSEFDEHRSMLSSIPKDKTIITYCDGQECNSSLDVATRLSTEGFSNVHFFFGGWSEWQINNSPTETGE